MFALRVTSSGQAPQTLVFASAEISIGRDPRSDLVLPASIVTPRHARIVIRDHRYIIVDLRSDNGTYVNARRIVQPLVVRPGDEILIGRDALAIVDVEAEWTDVDDDAADADELGLLRVIAAGDEGSRVVYADWLEQRDDARAELVRHEQLSPPRITSATTIPLRVLSLALATTIRWRARVTRPRIERCASAACPAEWGALAATDRDDVRRCVTCARGVAYCATVQMARHVTTPVVLDYLSLRWPRDVA